MSMSAPQHNLTEATRFIIRHLIAWGVVMGVGLMIIWFFTGFHEKLARMGWLASTVGIAFVVGFLIRHMSRVYTLTGYLNESVLGNRHDRDVELPCEAGEGLRLVETVVRANPYVDAIDIDHASLTMTAKIKVPDAGSGNDNFVLIRARVEDQDGVVRTYLRFEPEGNPLWDVLFPDGARNLDNATRIMRQLNERIAERRRADRASAEKSALEKQLTEAQLKLLQAQVEPHFLYNTLANAQLLTRSDPARADKMLGHLIDFLRSSLPQPTAHGANADADMSTLGQEVERSRAYLEVLRIRMGDRLKVEIDLPESLRQVPLPPLVLQTLVENAIKHGLEPKPGGGTLWIRAQQTGDMAKISVADDGVGFREGTAGTGLGLKNVRDRLKLLYGERGGLSLATNFPEGVTATLLVPLTREIKI
ncbi:MAG: sensor histidine kinase [Burkholderiales bacterium]|nr:sensor histidine kinase [Burkholderiales bacterium]